MLKDSLGGTKGIESFKLKAFKFDFFWEKKKNTVTW
jgi:hypothetical protein